MNRITLTLLWFGLWLLSGILLLRGCAVPPAQLPAPTASLTLALSDNELQEWLTAHDQQLLLSPSPTPTPTRTPLPPRPTATPFVELAVVDSLWEWNVIAGPAEDLAPPSDFDGELLVWEEEWRRPEVLWAQLAERRWELHTAPLGWGINEARISQGQVFLVEFNFQDGDYHLWEYTIASGTRALLEAWPGVPQRHQVPWLAPDAQHLAWSTTLADGRSCIRVREHATGRQYEARCAPDDSVVLDRPYLRWPVLTYQQLISEGDANCGTTYTLVLPHGEPQAHEVTVCEGFQGAGDAQVVAWTEMPSRTAYPWRVPIYGRGPTGEIVNLGVASAGSVAVCDGYAYWEKECSNCPDEIRTWRPGGPVEVIYRSPDKEGVHVYITTLPYCHGNSVVIQRTNVLYASPELMKEVLVAWRPENQP